MDASGTMQPILKRAFDIMGSVIGLIIFSPLMLYLYVRIKRDMGTPVIFQQIRPGLNGIPFKMIKFRSMRNKETASVIEEPDSDRITPLGRKLRNTSLDELPELWNVLIGEMSLVGPRPLLMEYLPLYTTDQAKRMDCKPGITGWAQINGRNGISWEEKFTLDCWYVQHQTLLLDIRILITTIFKVVRRDNINAENEATMPKFTGTGSQSEQ